MGLYGFTGHITGPRIKGPYWGPTVPSLEVQANVKQFRSSMQAAGFKLSGHESFTQLLGAALGSSLLPSLFIAVVPIFTDSTFQTGRGVGRFAADRLNTMLLCLLPILLKNITSVIITGMSCLLFAVVCFGESSRSCPIVPVMLGDARLASEMADEMLKRGIYAVSPEHQQ